MKTRLAIAMTLAALLAAFSASAQIIPVEDQKKFVDSLRNEFDNEIGRAFV